MTPAEQTLMMQVFIMAGILFVIGYLGNVLAFSNRFVNALVTAILFALIYGGIAYAAFVTDEASLREKVGSLTQEQWIQNIAAASAFVFVIDLIANMLAFQSRFVNALMTSIVFLIAFGGLMFLMSGTPSVGQAPA